jgi:hypothetical protein
MVEFLGNNVIHKEADILLPEAWVCVLKGRNYAAEAYCRNISFVCKYTVNK